jgi:hypothetical protein
MQVNVRIGGEGDRARLIDGSPPKARAVPSGLSPPRRLIVRRL